MANSIGKGFPTNNLQIGHIFCDVDDLTYWKYLGGNPRSVASWVLIHGVLNEQPDTSLWGLAQGGAFWFYAPEGMYYGWDGRQLIRIAFIGGESFYDYTRTIIVQEDFITGTNSGALIGWMGFASGAGTFTGLSSETNRPGIMNMATGTTPATVARMTFNGSLAMFLSGNIDLIWIVRLNDLDTDTTARVGYGSLTADDPPADGIYFEKLTGDTNWFCITRSATVETRTNSGVQIRAQFVTCRIKLINGTRVEFYLDDTLVATHTANITPNRVSPFLQIVNAGVVSKSIDMDYFQMYEENLTR